MNKFLIIKAQINNNLSIKLSIILSFAKICFARWNVQNVINSLWISFFFQIRRIFSQIKMNIYKSTHSSTKTIWKFAKQSDNQRQRQLWKFLRKFSFWKLKFFFLFICKLSCAFILNHLKYNWADSKLQSFIHKASGTRNSFCFVTVDIKKNSKFIRQRHLTPLRR